MSRLDDNIKALGPLVERLGRTVRAAGSAIKEVEVAIEVATEFGATDRAQACEEVLEKVKTHAAELKAAGGVTVEVRAMLAALAAGSGAGTVSKTSPAQPRQQTKKSKKKGHKDEKGKSGKKDRHVPALKLPEITSVPSSQAKGESSTSFRAWDRAAAYAPGGAETTLAAIVVVGAARNPWVALGGLSIVRATGWFGTWWGRRKEQRKEGT